MSGALNLADPTRTAEMAFMLLNGWSVGYVAKFMNLTSESVKRRLARAFGKDFVSQVYCERMGSLFDNSRGPRDFFGKDSTVNELGDNEATR